MPAIQKRSPKPNRASHAAGAKKTPANYEKFLEHLALTANITRSLEFAGISPTTLYNHRKADPEFAARWEEAWQRGYDTLEQKCADRAFEGVSEPVLFQGQQVYVKDPVTGKRVALTKTTWSDSLAQFLLRGNKQSKFRERTENINLNANVETDEEDLRAQLRAKLFG